jgi:hypothetical protein
LRKHETELFDAAFLLAKEAAGDGAHERARARLASDHADAGTADIGCAYDAARALAGACYDFGDRCRLGWMTDDEAVRTMRRRFPGFSEATYRAALAHGYFVSR